MGGGVERAVLPSDVDGSADAGGGGRMDVGWVEEAGNPRY